MPGKVFWCSLFTFSLSTVLHAVPDGFRIFPREWLQVNYVEAEIESRGVRGFKPDENLALSVSWKENIQDLFFRNLKTTKFKQTTDITTCYDGEMYAILDRSFKISLLKVQKKIPKESANFNSGFFLLTPYQFLVKTERGNEMSCPSLKKLKDSESDVSIKKAISGIVEVEFGNTPALCMNLDGGIHIWNGRTYNYKVFFSKVPPYDLLGWRTYFENQTMTSELRIEEWNTAKIRNLKYPSKYTLTYFLLSPLADQNNKIRYQYEVNVKIKGISDNPDESDFMIDPSIADFIYDVDSGVTMRTHR